jgi:cytochrome b involved in lipid metabolism/F0F1-type ATP synthase membrane subunit c/vacuolar-type H+-ATPase subunit K
MTQNLLKSSLFDTIGGLPIHPLAVHVAVVLLPLSALALALLIFVPKWRAAYLPLTLAGLAVSTGFSYLAKESGEALAERVGEPQTHEALGTILFPAAVGLLALGVAFYFLQRFKRPKWQIQAAAAAALLAIASVTTLTYFVGHTCAEATWAHRINPVEAAPITDPVTPGTDSPAVGLTATEVAKHNTGTDCWSVVGGNVFDLTSYVSSHPGGAAVIKAICGKDGSAAFAGQHSGASKPANVLASYKLGVLGAGAGASAPLPAATVPAGEGEEQEGDD